MRKLALSMRVTEASNYMKHLGFDLKIKDKSFAASYAADFFCK